MSHQVTIRYMFPLTRDPGEASSTPLLSRLILGSDCLGKGRGHHLWRSIIRISYRRRQPHSLTSRHCRLDNELPLPFSCGKEPQARCGDRKPIQVRSW
jgi:hypothetical protein